MTRHRATRFLLAPTRETQDAQNAKESKHRAVRFSLRQRFTHRHRALLADSWAANILFSPNPFKESK